MKRAQMVQEVKGHNQRKQYLQMTFGFYFA